MKQLIIGLTCLLSLMSIEANENGVRFLNKPIKKVYKKAAKMNKPIFVDVYADWCGPCKMMDKEVFAREDVAAFLNQHFICLKMDADNDDYLYEKFEYEITKLPTFLFLAPDGKLLKKYVGSTTGSNLMAMAKDVLAG